MLVEFSVSNYRSIGDEQILSLVPSEQLIKMRYLQNGSIAKKQHLWKSCYLNDKLI